MKQSFPFLLTLLTFSTAEGWQGYGSFTLTGSMLTPRFQHTATLLPDGKVLICGGWTRSDLTHTVATNTAELYDPEKATFSSAGNMIAARATHTATLLPNGKVLIAGGSGEASTELYDPVSRTFTAAATMTTIRSGHTATLLLDGRVLMAAGSAGTSAEIYDPTLDAFTSTGAMNTVSYGLSTSTLLTDGKVLVTLGSERSAEVYDPETGTFSSTPPRSPWVQGSSALLLNGQVLLAGGNDDPGESALALVYNPADGTFSTTGKLNHPRADAVATMMPDGTVLITGSNGDGGATLASAEVYDPSTAAFDQTGDMVVDRGLHTATVLNDGRVLVTGGIHKVGQTWPPLASAEVYNAAPKVERPLLFERSEEGDQVGAIWHADGNAVSPGKPAVRGEVLSMYTAHLVHGGVVAPQIILGQQFAPVVFFGVAPSYPGYFQINFKVPDGAPSGRAVPVRLTYLGRSSNEVKVSVQ